MKAAQLGPELFEVEPVEDMVAVGAVTEDSARLWLRSRLPGLVKVRIWSEPDAADERRLEVEVPADDAADQTLAFTVGAEQHPLRPGTRYGYRMLSPGGYVLGEGRFETSPAADAEPPQRFSLAFWSCNQPFDPHGRPRKPSPKMLRAVRACLERHDVKRVLVVGDQIYADYPSERSLFDEDYFRRVGPAGRSSILDCTPDEVRRLYQRRYRYFWALPELRWLYANNPCCPIWDDHDIVDNWGSVAAHQRPPWTSVGAGARLAYADYQASRVLPVHPDPPDSFYYELTYGDVAIFVADLRGERRAGDKGRLFAPPQLEAIRTFLRNHRDLPLLFLVLSVPLVHLPRAVARLVAKLPPKNEDFSDRWSSGAHVRDRDRMLSLLREHLRATPHQRLFLLSGDIHIGCAQRIHLGDQQLHQLVSSPVTHATGPVISLASKLLVQLNRHISTMDGRLEGDVRLVRADGPSSNPHAGLNIGIIEISRRPGSSAPPEVRFLLYGHRGDRPVCVFRSVAL